MYLDSLELEGMEIDQDGIRVTVWTNEMVREAIKQDTFSDGTFGRAQVCPYLFFLHHFFCYIFIFATFLFGGQCIYFSEQHLIFSYVQLKACFRRTEFQNGESDAELLVEGSPAKSDGGDVYSDKYQDIGHDEHGKTPHTYMDKEHDQAEPKRGDDVSCESGFSGNEAPTDGSKMEDQSVLFAEPNNINRFVDVNTPEGCTNEVSFRNTKNMYPKLVLLA